ncbi:hypothetical protein [Arcticibacter sp.]|jgi:hypothetical protein|uniref:hypothetical protein n=1 Tax=Arcticibacter sp. TaxID=1872630 RepID=UPI003890E57D
MNRLFTILFLLVSLSLSASEERDKVNPETIETIGSVKVSPTFVKPKWENLNRGLADSVLTRPVVQVPSMRKQSKRYRPASAPGLQKKLNWVFAY